jgi:NTE family protein
VNLALQGGGAHGAFTWGVLDYLLEDGRVSVEGVTGTSAGAMNAVVLAQGLMTGGREGAREALGRFWGAVAHSAPFVTSLPSGDGIPVLAPLPRLMLQLADVLSPALLNPFDLNPLRDIVAEHVDFDALRRQSPVKLFVATTHANSGKLRVFRETELSADVLLASACLPTIHRTVVVDGEPYWDGGYSANPAVFPVIYECDAADVVLVLLTPLRHAETPQSAQGIRTRQRELAFQSSFLGEMRTIAQLHDYVGDSWVHLGRLERRLTRTRFHVIAAEELMGGLPTETKLIADKAFFELLRDKGREHARAWVERDGAALGKRSSVNLTSLFC